MSWKNVDIWWMWRFSLKNGSCVGGGSSFATKGYALDAALWSASKKESEVVKIEIYPTTR